MPALRSGPELLPARLEAVLAEAGPCALLVDLCADHARLAIAACARKVATSAVAVDLHAAPLRDARARLRGTKLADRVLLVRGDGLQALRSVDSKSTVLVIAGVGGDLAAQILERDSQQLLTIDRIVVQPERHAREVRAWMRDNGFHLITEQAIPEARRLHLVLRFQRAPGADLSYGAHPLEAELRLGPRLLRSSEAAAIAWLRREHLRLKKIGVRRPDFAEALDVLERAKQDWLAQSR
jgi:tRNA (adenine22-N1)-methyltransferase